MPFHYGTFDRADGERLPGTANELTHTEWDPVSKQPLYKVTPVRVEKAAPAGTPMTGEPTGEMTGEGPS